MAVVEGKTDAVQPEALEERRVLVLEEVLEELRRAMSAPIVLQSKAIATHLVEEEFRLLRANRVGERLADLELAAGITRDEVLHTARVSPNYDLPSLSGNGTHVIHPPRPAPRKITSSPASFTIRVLSTFRNPVMSRTLQSLDTLSVWSDRR